MKTATEPNSLKAAGWKREKSPDLTPEMRAFLGAASAEGDILLYDLVARFRNEFANPDGSYMDGTQAGRLIGRWIVETC